MRAMLDFVGEDVRQGLPDVPREPPLRPHRQLRPGDGAAVRAVGAPLPALPPASGAGDPDPAAGDRAARLHGGLMETPAAAPRAPAPGTVPLPHRRRAADRQRVRARRPARRRPKRLLDRILAAAPNQGDALHLSGIVAFRQGEIATALDLMERSLTHGIDTPLYLRNICEVYRALGRLDEALETARRATALAPADPLCLHNQAIIHYHRLELDECLDCAERALRIDPSLPGAHFVRAEALLLRGEWAEGWDEYEWRFRIAGAAPLMPPTDQAAMGWHGVRRPHAAADRRPGVRRCDPVRALHSVGGGAVSRHRHRLQRARCSRCCVRSRRTRGSSCAGRMRPTMPRSVRCPACRGWPARGPTTFRRRCRICTPIRLASRSGPNGWTAWCRRASAASA